MKKNKYLVSMYERAIPWAKANEVQLIYNKLLGRYAVFQYINNYKKHKISINDSAAVVDNVVISLTTFPARINKAFYCIFSILNQTIRPKKTILYLSKEEFPEGNGSLPKCYEYLIDNGLEIQYVNENIKSYKKFFYSALEYSEMRIVTADDDVLYPEDWLERLVKKSDENENLVVCYRAHEITIGNNGINPYEKWISLAKDTIGPSHLLFPVGVGGVLYPRNYFSGFNFNWSIIKKIAPSSDDVLLKFYGMSQKISAVKVDKNNREWFTIPGSQRFRLSISNVDKGNGNNRAIKRAVKFYHLDLSDLLYY